MSGPRMDLAPEREDCSNCDGLGEVCSNCEEPKEECMCDPDWPQVTCRDCEGMGR